MSSIFSLMKVLSRINQMYPEFCDLLYNLVYEKVCLILVELNKIDIISSVNICFI